MSGSAGGSGKRAGGNARTAPRSTRLVYGVQHLDHRPLEDLVFQRSDPERPKPPVRLRYEHPPSGHRPIRPSLDPGVQIANVRFEIQPVVPPRNPVDPLGRRSG
jgi:hypothetical protein